MVEMRSVYSSRVDSIGFENGRLFVRWAKGGKTSVYEGVPEELADQVMRSPSIGSALRMSIENQYPHSYE